MADTEDKILYKSTVFVYNCRCESGIPQSELPPKCDRNYISGQRKGRGV